MEIEESNPMEEACISYGLYLNMTGTAEAVSNALLNLFLLKEKPENPVEFIRENLDPKTNEVIAKLKKEIQSAEQELAQLNEIAAEYKAKSIKLIAEQAKAALELDADTLADGSEENVMSSEAIDGSAEIDKQSTQPNSKGDEVNVESKPNTENPKIEIDSKSAADSAEFKAEMKPNTETTDFETDSKLNADATESESKSIAESTESKAESKTNERAI